MTRPSREWVRAARAAGAAGLLCAAAPLRAQAPPDEAAAAPAVRLATRGPADYGWQLQTLDGRAVSLDAYRGRVVFVNVWATWCPPCVNELASVQRLHDSLAGAPVAFLLVSPERREAVAPFVRRRGLTVPVFLEVAEMPAAFGLEALPTTWVIAPDGGIVLKHRGAADWDSDAMRDFLRALAR